MAEEDRPIPNFAEIERTQGPEAAVQAALEMLRSEEITKAGDFQLAMEDSLETNPDFVLDLSGQDLSDLDLDRMDFTNANLQNVSLVRASLRGARLPGADLFGADCTEADLFNVNLAEANVQSTIFTDTKGVLIISPEEINQRALEQGVGADFWPEGTPIVLVDSDLMDIRPGSFEVDQLMADFTGQVEVEEIPAVGPYGQQGDVGGRRSIRILAGGYFGEIEGLYERWEQELGDPEEFRTYVDVIIPMINEKFREADILYQQNLEDLRDVTDFDEMESLEIPWAGAEDAMMSFLDYLEDLFGSLGEDENDDDIDNNGDLGLPPGPDDLSP